MLEDYSLDFFMCPSIKIPHCNYKTSSKGQHILEVFATKNWGIGMGVVSTLSFLFELQKSHGKIMKVEKLRTLSFKMPSKAWFFFPIYLQFSLKLSDENFEIINALNYNLVHCSCLTGFVYNPLLMTPFIFLSPLSIYILAVIAYKQNSSW